VFKSILNDDNTKRPPIITSLVEQQKDSSNPLLHTDNLKDSLDMLLFNLAHTGPVNVYGTAFDVAVALLGPLHLSVDSESEQEEEETIVASL